MKPIEHESAALSKWYATHSKVRRMWAIRDAHGLRVLVSLEPTLDGDDIYPVWIANGRAWVNELQQCTETTVRLEQIDEPVFDGIANAAAGVMVAALNWRDPSTF